jgi:hypothetical protein
MTNMALGAYAFANNPAGFPIIGKKRAATHVETIGGVEFFSWGVFVAGQKVELSWNWMTPAQFTALNQILEADAQVVWNPQTGTTYNVQVLKLDGEFHGDLSGSAHYRKNVKLTLLIIGVAA